MKCLFFAAFLWSAVSFATESSNNLEAAKGSVPTQKSYQMLEVKRGDLVTGFKEEAVDTPEKAMQLFESMKDTDSVSVERNEDIEAQ